ncbi:MAG: type II secretion system protein [Pseudomonadota bacterium]
MSGTATQVRGFTLIEVVIVIAILGVLAAIAVPRFIDLREEAQTATTQQIHGGFTSALNILHAEWAVRGSSAVTTNSAGWPVGTGGGSLMSNARCVAVWNAVLTSPPRIDPGYNPDTEGWGRWVRARSASTSTSRTTRPFASSPTIPPTG